MVSTLSYVVIRISTTPRFLSAGFMITVSVMWLNFLIVSLSAFVTLGLSGLVSVGNWSFRLFFC